MNLDLKLLKTMATEQNKPSVIGKLMGLDEAPRQRQPVYRQQRVFSENYLLKSASIGSHEKTSSKIRQKPKIKKHSRNNDSFDSIQGLKLPIVDSQTIDIEKRNDLAAKGLVIRPNLGNVNQASKPLFLLDSYTTFGWEFKKQLLERSKRTKVCQEIWSSKRVCNLGEPPFMLDLESNQRRVINIISSSDGWKDKSVTKLPMFKHFNISSSSNTKFKKMCKSDLRLSSEFSSSLDASFEKKLPSEAEFTSSNCIDNYDDFPKSIGEVYQPSPNSVLEPDNSSSSEYGDNLSTDLCGLWMKLQILKSESEENQSNKSAIVALSDEDATERSFYIQSLGPKESQQFSYLVNVLNELGFQNGNVEVSLERCITKPLIFETLEKKYGKQESWNKADKRLLFDRINLGLTEIVWSKSLRRKMSNFLRRDMVEEELWNMLLSQEKEVNVDLSKKAVGKEPWLELGDEVDFIVVEIEAFLFNELATELVAI